jgi:tetratricopeptide (TPR) repeat protein/TolB-like protein
MRRQLLTRILALLYLVIFIYARTAGAQQPATNPRAVQPRPATPTTGIYLVFPFENVGASPRLDWLGEGLEELTVQRLSAAGEQVYSHAGLASELDSFGLPASSKLSRASMIRIAQDLDADYVIFGGFTSDGQNLTIDSRILRMDPLSLLPPVRESGPLDSLMELHSQLLWKLISSNDHSYPFTLEQYSKTQPSLRLDAFEHYIRGLLANDDDAKVRELREAARLEPGWPDPAFALGDAYFTKRDCDSALPWLERVPKANARYVEAVFSTGVCRLLLNQPDRAEQVFTELEQDLGNDIISGADLPEILNDLALSLERQGKGPVALDDLRRATEIDPDDDDYPFNLGLLALRGKDYAAAAESFREASQRDPENAEDRALLILSLEQAGQKAEADQERESASEVLGPNALPTIRLDRRGDAHGQTLASMERISTSLDTTALRLEIESPESATGNPAAQPVADTPAVHARRGRMELAAGRLDTAESEFRAVLAAVPANAQAHRGLGEIYRRRGKLDDAAKEFQSSLEIRDSAAVHTLLARVYLEQKKDDLARAELEHALKLAPNFSQAKQLLEHLQNAKPPGGAQ